MLGRSDFTVRPLPCWKGKRAVSFVAGVPLHRLVSPRDSESSEAPTSLASVYFWWCDSITKNYKETREKIQQNMQAMTFKQGLPGIAWKRRLRNYQPTRDESVPQLKFKFCLCYQVTSRKWVTKHPGLLKGLNNECNSRSTWQVRDPEHKLSAVVTATVLITLATFVTFSYTLNSKT